jgi:hypothetical protein
MQRLGFVTLIGSEHVAADGALLLSSLRQFGGDISSAPLWVFHAESTLPGAFDFDAKDVHPVSLELEPTPHGIPFGAKVSACAHAERYLAGEIETLVWINPRALIIQPPVAFQLDQSHRAALRPVHIKNIGSPIDQHPDPFWQAIYDFLGVDGSLNSVESYVDLQRIRPYFNTHMFAINPKLGLLEAWLDAFKELTEDDKFTLEYCADDLHRIFLHQALFSALLTQQLAWNQIRILPMEYSYPLHLHDTIPLERQAKSLDELICPVYEDTFEYPRTLNGLSASEHLASWLRSQPGASPAGSGTVQSGRE